MPTSEIYFPVYLKFVTRHLFTSCHNILQSVYIIAVDLWQQAPIEKNEKIKQRRRTTLLQKSSALTRLNELMGDQENGGGHCSHPPNEDSSVGAVSVRHYLGTFLGLNVTPICDRCAFAARNN